MTLAQELPVFIDTSIMSEDDFAMILSEQDRQFEEDFRHIASSLRNDETSSISNKDLFNDLMEVRKDHFAQRQYQPTDEVYYV